MPTTGSTLFQRLTRRLRMAARFLIPRSGALAEPPPVERRAAAQTGRPVRRPKVSRQLLPFALGLLALAQSAAAATIYVDSRIGDDRLDGLTVEQVSDYSGPVRTLHRAVMLVRSGDQIVLANNGAPYRGGLALYGLQHSGSPDFPIEVVGNGCVLTGAKPIEPGAWRMVGNDLWRITPQRKGWYQLVLDGAAVPEVRAEPGATSPPALTPHSWCAFEGAVYYCPPEDQDAPDLPLELADEQTGLTLLACEHIVIRDLTVQHFRQDGINLHDRCRNVLLENVTCRGNGRTGVVVGGTSSVLLRNVTCAGNREASLRIEELGVADAEGSTFDTRPVVQSR